MLESQSLNALRSAIDPFRSKTVEGQPLQTLDPVTHAAPKSRIGTAVDCCQYVQYLIQNDLTRATHRNKVKGMIDGNAPWNRSELVSRGQGNNTNLNFRQGDAIIKQYAGPYYDLITEVPLLAKIETGFGTSTERGDWGQIISEEFHRMVTNWESWDEIIQFSQFQMLVYGAGPLYFRDEVDWRPECAKNSDMLLEDGASSRITEVEGIVLLKDYIPSKLYRKIYDPQAATALGWDVEEVEWGIIQSKFPGSTPNDARVVEWYQQKFKNADMFNGEGAVVRSAHVLVAEFDGRVSHHICRSDQTRSKFMYSRLNVFESMADAVVPFQFDIGDGTWHSIRGLGNAIYPYIEVFNRLRCKEVDGAMIAASVLLKSNDSNAMSKAQLLKINNLAILPPGLDVASTNIGQGIDATTQVRRDMEMGLNNNIGLLQQAPGQPNPRQGQKAKMMEMQQRAQLGKGNINRCYRFFDWLYQKMYWRAVKATASQPGGKSAVEFQTRCFKRGVPPEALKEIDNINAYRSAGAGSAVNALMVTETLMQYLGEFPDAGQEEIKRLFVSRLAGNDTMHAVMGDVKKSEESQDDWEAFMENQALRQGGQGKIAEGQSDVLHLEAHISDAEKHVAEVQQDAQQGGGMDFGMLQGLATHLDAAGHHSQQHLAVIQKAESKQKQVKDFTKRLMGLGRVADKTKQHLQEMQKAMEAQQPQPNPEALKSIPYDKAPESVKLQLEQAAGVNRQPGDLSTPAQKLIDQHIKTQIKAQQTKARMTLDDVKTADQLRQNAA